MQLKFTSELNIKHTLVPPISPWPHFTGPVWQLTLALQRTADINVFKDSVCTRITRILQYLYLNFSIFVK